ncbi:MAG: TlpA family protein disulfide reductase [Planctomycetes bacterium]|nr:TlpA family protein disulfide reductase [Planctomycetota bacterium]
MRKFNSLVVGFGVLCLWGGESVCAALKVGDVAPPVTVTDWIKGKPMDILKDGKGKVVVLEFWATWCPPCIQLIPDNTALYKRYKDQGLIFVGITDTGQGQQLKSVQDFVAKQGDRMSYPIAFDRTQKTNIEYVMGTGAVGIPHSVIIGKDGRVAWFGHPLEPMESTIKDLLLDRFDPKKAALEAEKQAKLATLMNDFNFAIQRGDWDRCLSLTDQMLTVDPANFDAMRFNVYIFVEELRSPERLKTWSKAMMTKNADNAKAMAIMSSLMLAMPGLTDRQPEMAVQAANLSLASTSKSSDTLQMVAQVFFQMGLVEQAIEAQTKAVAAADKFDVENVQGVLTFFERCRSARSSVQF